MTTNYGQQVYSQGSGTANTTLLDAVRLPRNPTSGDTGYPLGKNWVNTTSNGVWYLASYTTTSGSTLANWVNLSAGSILAGIDTINTVPPDGSGNFTLESSDSSISITPIANGLDLTVASSSTVYQGNSGGNVTPNPVGEILTINGNNSSGINVIGNSPLYTLTVTAIQATTTQQGAVTLATNAQAIAGVNTMNAVTPSALAAKLGTQTAHSLAVFEGSTSALTALGAATNGQLPIGSTGADPVLANITSSGGTITVTNGAGSINLEVTGGSAIDTIDGDSGSATGSTITIYANQAANYAGGTVQFLASGSTVLFVVSDGNANTCIGVGSGNPTGLTGADNCAFGSQALSSAVATNQNTSIGRLTLSALTTSNGGNVALGEECLRYLVTGQVNLAVGYQSGTNYTGAESSNVLVYNKGVIGESNVIRIGQQGSGVTQQNICYIAGITGATPTSANTPQVVLCDNAGNLAPISSSTSGYVLTSNGTATPSFQAIPISSILTITTVNHLASPYTVLAADEFLAVDVSGGVVTIKLPNAPTTGRVIYIKDSTGTAAASNISVTTVGGAVTIDGQTTYTMATNYQSLSIIFDGSNYEVF